MGFVDSMINDEVVRAAIIDSGAVFGGTSSGALTAAYAMASLNGVGTMEEWYQTEMRKGFEAVQRHSTLVMGEELLHASRRFYARCLNATLLKAGRQLAGPGGGEHENSDALVPWLQAFPVSLTELATLKPVFFHKFTSGETFATIMQASSFVPWVMGIKPWLTVDYHTTSVEGGGGSGGCEKPRSGDNEAGKFNNDAINSSNDDSHNRSSPSYRKVVDGYVGMWSTSWPSTYMYVGFLPTYPVQLLGSASFLRAFDFDSSAGGVLGFFSKSLPWGDPDWADAAFQRGQRDALAGRDKLRSEMCVFLGSC